MGPEIRQPKGWEPVSILGAAIFDIVEFGSVYIDAHVNLAELQEMFPRTLEIRDLGAGVRFVSDTGQDRDADLPIESTGYRYHRAHIAPRGVV